MDHNPSGRRPHYHRGRRGTDRRGSDRRNLQQAAEQSPRSSGDQVDVDQIMREIRSRVSQRHGIDLTPQQIQDLAARRLEAILDPRNVSPNLFDQLRKSAAATPDPAPAAGEGELSITENAIYEGSGMVRFFRRLLNPLLKLFFNPTPLIAALQTQGRINREAVARAAERERRQTEWNALHYQVLQRLVTEVSRGSLEVQALVSRVEALAARVDFNDRRIRTIESAPTPARNQRTHEAPPQPTPAPVENVAGESGANQPTPALAPSGQPDGQRRRRRRRRGRRGSTPGGEAAGIAATTTLAPPDASPDHGPDGEDDDEIHDSAETASESTPLLGAPEAPLPVVSGPPVDVPEAPVDIMLEPPASVVPEPLPSSHTPETRSVALMPEPGPGAWPEPPPTPAAGPVPAPGVDPSDQGNSGS